MFRRENVRFPAEGSIELSAWLFAPERQEAPLPSITMAIAPIQKAAWCFRPSQQDRLLASFGLWS